MQNGARSKHVLLVDGGREFCVTIERAFRLAVPAHSVFSHGDGQRAIEHLALCGGRYPVPDVVLINRELPPGPDGFAVVRALRALDPCASTLVLLMGGSSEAEDFTQARAAGADGYMTKPPEKGDYPGLVAQVIAWQPEERRRGFGGGVSGFALATREGRVVSVPDSSAPMHNGPDSTFLPLPQEPHVLVRVFEHFRDMVRQSFDQVDLAISDACRRHHIPPAHARGRGQDQVTVANRQAVIFDLFDIGYSDKVITDNFFLSERQIERLRAAWRAKGGGLLSDGKS